MSRTPEQRVADEALTAAIEQTLRAYNGDEPWILTEYVVVTSQHTINDDGEPLTAIGCLHRDGDIPLHRALGLVEYAATRYRKRATEDE